MPTYEYACKSCGEHLEVVQSFRDDPLTSCPNCSGELRKVFGAIGIAFKGSGFYRTDSRDATGGGKAKAESKSESKPDTKEKASSGQGDSKAKGADSGSGDAKTAAPKGDSSSSSKAAASS